MRRIGAWREGDGIKFRLWAPNAANVEVVCKGQKHEMKPQERGYYEYFSNQVQVGDRYKFRLDGKTEVPDPVSRYQPEGPHGHSEVVDDDYPWTDQNWKCAPLEEWVIYELHVGTFTKEGTFAAVEKKLAHLKELGINCIEIMPVAQFAGKRNWGYDGVGLFAAQNSYGDDKCISPLALKHLVQACHAHGLAVILDVVYNHMGPEGNYLSQFGPYFQNKYKTPWGEALNYDGEWCDEVRHFFLENARQWMEEFHFDGLRLDAIHAIFDTSAKPFLEELTEMKRDLEKKTGRRYYLIAESETNDSRILHPPAQGGLGLDGQWADDLHHVVHALVTGENQGYYQDFGTVEQLATAYRDGVVFHGEYSGFRHRSHGRRYDDVDHRRLVVCSQNHDQIGNRRDGDRLISIAGPKKQKLAAACVLLSSALPLLFMGEEFAETAPFQYFVDHTDKELLEAVRKGRREEFKDFKWEGEVPDPASAKTFEDSKLNWERAGSDPLAKEFLSYYRQLIYLSKWIRRSGVLKTGSVQTKLHEGDQILAVHGAQGGSQIRIYFNFSDKTLSLPKEFAGQGLDLVLNSAENMAFEEGQISAHSVLVWSKGSS